MSDAYSSWESSTTHQSPESPPPAPTMGSSPANQDYGKRKFVPKESKPASVDLFYGLSLDKDAPDDVVRNAEAVIRLFEAKGFTLRLPAPPKGNTSHKVLAQVTSKIERVIPWKGFDDIEGDYYTTNPGKMLTKLIVPTYENVPENVQSIAANHVHLVLGKFLNEAAKCCVIWTPDGCAHARDIGRETGFTVRDTIRICGIYGVPIFNLGNNNATNDINSFLNDFISYK